MKIKIEANKRQITIIASGNEKKVLSLIVAFAGGSLKNVNSGLLNRLTSSFINTIVIDMNHESITKEFIQLLLRFK
jgi:hypothetical protein